MALFQSKKSQDTSRVDVQKKSAVVFKASQTIQCENKRSVGFFDLENGSVHKYLLV